MIHPYNEVPISSANQMNQNESEMHWVNQDDLRAYILNDLGKEQWLSVFSSQRDAREDQVYFSALLPNAYKAKALEGSSWEMSCGDGRPGCSQHYEGDKVITEYLRYGKTSGIEPLIICRGFYGIRPDYWEVSEEFRLYHDLYYDEKRKVYTKILDNGEEEDVIQMNGRAGIRIRLKYLKQYLTMKDMCLAIFFDHRRFSHVTMQDLALKKDEETYQDGAVRFDFNARAWESSFGDDSRKSFSRVVGKKIVQGFDDKEKTGIWPQEEEETYEQFIVGTDENGEPRLYSCDPDGLANNFGANPEAPNFLTPIAFRPEVLERYYKKPSMYSVEDGYLRCGSLWGLYMDNNHPQYVMAFLGDLGHLNRTEQKHWAAYQVMRDRGISGVAFARAFAAQFAEPTRADLRFRYLFEDLLGHWQKKWKWQLFLPLRHDDEHFLKTLHIPPHDEQSQFDEQILALAKTVVDSINQEGISKALTDQPKRETPKQLDYLEQLLQEKGMPDYQKHIQLLRDIQSLRSAGGAHRKGDNFDKIGKKMGLGTNDLRLVFEKLLTGLNEFMEALKTL